jgi:hypothetical protein
MTEEAIVAAYELAKSGQCRSVSEVVRHLPAQYREPVEQHLAAHAARREFILLCSAAWLARD